MDKPTQMISEYVSEKGINLSNLSVKTGIPYDSIYASLANKNRDRDLRGGELIAICAFLNLDPMDLRVPQRLFKENVGWG